MAGQAAKASGGPTNRGGRSRAGAAKKAVAVAARDRAKASLTIGEVSIVMEDIEPATVTFPAPRIYFKPVADQI